MKTPAITIFVLALCLSISTRAAEQNTEEKVTFENIPAAAAKALKEQAGGEKIKGLSKEKDEGKTVYEATFSRKGRVHDVTVSEDGKLVSDEETIPAAEAPKVVRAALEKELPGGKIEKMELIREDGKISYEALISAGDKRQEIKLDSKGKVLEREDKTREKKKD